MVVAGVAAHGRTFLTGIVQEATSGYVGDRRQLVDRDDRFVIHVYLPGISWLYGRDDRRVDGRCGSSAEVARRLLCC